MSIAEQINGVGTELSNAGLVGRQVFVNGTVATVTAVDGDEALTDGAGTVDLALACANVLPVMGEVVLLHGQRAVWLEAIQKTHRLVGVVLVGGQVQERTLYEVSSVVVAGEEPLDRQLCRALASTHAEHREQMQRLNVEANEWADDNDLCSRYDDFMERQGLEGRVREYRASITITFSEDVEGRSFDDATNWTAADVVRMATEYGDHLDWEVEEQ